MDDPWDEQPRRPHPMIYCLVIVVCAAVLLALLLPAFMGVTP